MIIIKKISRTYVPWEINKLSNNAFLDKAFKKIKNKPKKTNTLAAIIEANGYDKEHKLLKKINVKMDFNEPPANELQNLIEANKSIYSQSFSLPPEKVSKNTKKFLFPFLCIILIRIVCYIVDYYIVDVKEVFVFMYLVSFIACICDISNLFDKVKKQFKNWLEKQKFNSEYIKSSTAKVNTVFCIVLGGTISLLAFLLVFLIFKYNKKIELGTLILDIISILALGLSILEDEFVDIITYLFKKRLYNKQRRGIAKHEKITKKST